ncbi:MAG TPA: patatin-like phospholipase family protein [bacterium]|nr:patatin-like phospholipase family protein [bacterium]HPP29611.1 patatin-like phospholipase family protein [bacterium]
MLYRNALVLGGGGAKGFAHIGAIITLEQENLRPDIICGTSSGSIAGSLYALYSGRIKELEKIDETREFKILKRLKLNPLEMEQKQGFFANVLSNIKRNMMFIKILRDNALVRKEDVEPVFRELFGNIKFEDLSVKLIAVAFDLISGRDVYIQSGPLWKGVLASCSIPGIFPPFEYNDMVLIDGGITNRLPVKCAVLSGVENIIAIDISNPPSPEKKIGSAVNLHLYIDELIAFRFDLYNKEMADVVLNPALENMKWDEFSKYNYAVEKGKEITKENIPAIRQVMKSKRYLYKKRLKKLIGKRITPPLNEEFIFL